MQKTLKDLSLLVFFVFITTFFIWLPHILALPNFWGLNFSNGFNTIYRNFDGLEYIVIAKTFYDSQAISSLPIFLPASYFPAHFPGYSILINIPAPMIGYLKSMLLVSFISTILAIWTFYFLVRDFKLTQHPLLLSSIFLILPARWLIVHSVGSSEPTFIFFTLASIYFFMKFEQSKTFINIFLAGIFGLFAQITRPPGVLLLIAYGLYIFYRFYIESKANLKKAFFESFTYYPLLLIPLGLLGVFYLFSIKLGNFWAYFYTGDNIHLTFPPFQVFNKHQFWVGDIWLEDLVYTFIFGFLGGVLLIKQRLLPVAFFVLTYLTASILIAHRDISRYILPITPFVLIAFEKVLTSREFKIILPIIILTIYLYSQNFILENIAPIPNLNLFN